MEGENQGLRHGDCHEERDWGFYGSRGFIAHIVILEESKPFCLMLLSLADYMDYADDSVESLLENSLF